MTIQSCCYVCTPDRALAMQLLMCQFMENRKTGKWHDCVWAEQAASTAREIPFLQVKNWQGSNSNMASWQHLSNRVTLKRNTNCQVRLIKCYL